MWKITHTKYFASAGVFSTPAPHFCKMPEVSDYGPNALIEQLCTWINFKTGTQYHNAKVLTHYKTKTGLQGNTMKELLTANRSSIRVDINKQTMASEKKSDKYTLLILITFTI